MLTLEASKLENVLFLSTVLIHLSGQFKSRKKFSLIFKVLYILFLIILYN